MQTNMHLKSPDGGTSLSSFPGIAVALSKVIRDQPRKSESVLKSKAPDWSHLQMCLGAGFIVTPPATVLNSDEQIQ